MKCVCPFQWMLLPLGNRESTFYIRKLIVARRRIVESNGSSIIIFIESSVFFSETGTDNTFTNCKHSCLFHHPHPCMFSDICVCWHRDVQTYNFNNGRRCCLTVITVCFSLILRGMSTVFSRASWMLSLVAVFIHLLLPILMGLLAFCSCCLTQGALCIFWVFIFIWSILCEYLLPGSRMSFYFCLVSFLPSKYTSTSYCNSHLLCTTKSGHWRLLALITTSFLYTTYIIEAPASCCAHRLYTKCGFSYYLYDWSTFLFSVL